jgi:hypothetical protein
MKREFLDRFKAEEKLQSHIREEIARHVQKWVFSDWQLWDPLTNRGDNSVSTLPDGEGAHYAYGYDQKGRPIIVRHFKTEIDPEKTKVSRGLVHRVTKEVLVEEFIRYERDNVYLYSRYLNGSLIYICRLTFEEGKLMENESVHHGYYSRGQNIYDGRRLSIYRTVDDSGRVLEESVHERGQPARHYRVRRDGTRFELYQPLPKGVTVKSLLATVKERLIKLIPETMAKAGVAEPIYAIALAYDGEGNGVLPPILGVGLESERERWIAEHGNDADEYIWNPAEWENYQMSNLEINDDKFVEACDLVTTALAERTSEAPAIKMLVEVCSELNRTAWPSDIKRTDDFVIYPVDFELSRLKRNLKASTTAEQLEKVEKLSAMGRRPRKR